MTSLIVDYLAKSIIFLFFDFYFIFNNFDPVEIENENRKEPAFLEKLSTYILDE